MAGRVIVDEALLRDWAHKDNGPIVKALTHAAEVVLQGAKRRCPTSPQGSTDEHGVHHPSGWLRSSLHAEVTRDNQGPVARVGSDVEYALFVEFGTKMHVIRSKGPWPLRDDKGHVFGKVVIHPGTPAQPFLRPALDDLHGANLQ